MKGGREESCDRKGKNRGKWRLELYLGSRGVGSRGWISIPEEEGETNNSKVVFIKPQTLCALWCFFVCLFFVMICYL